MKNVFALLFGLATLIPLKASADSTFVFFRHGEKPDNASGQLTCKGLNRALKLPRVLLSRYGNPDALYASAPKEDKTGSSLRPLSTLIPLAVQVSQPVILRFHADKPNKLVADLLAEKAVPLTFISWEHKNLVTAARRLVEKTGGDAGQVPDWSATDFDSVYVVKIDDNQHFKSFKQDAEGLNGVSSDCPDR
ncbi:MULTISPECIES: histidine phosphatase family protein [Pantoea]|uniref:ATP/GTP-binding transmembrane protein n=1 Tax=Pantoea stewartii subsp. stewartii DC283 TaxID=660596 RepID=H3RE28_PANSE|nr:MULTISPECIES: histidine phosphatase family protein [Pantoea]KKW49190.1 ATP/GTP binding motif protein [Pantoea ananatis]ARF49888.1 histidine phosphatase family protein [Pantoea stewartii subsp. stewartii DC283]EHU00371.1 ATP/GTP-binding transmembrane protein [Pantoea stewartii subsp. stewartii DC283]KAB0549366.1 histidine phosphatase family protein [Pantoea stewartii subsp. stewartii]KHE03336.1 ATP/GTP binding motif protein [Pantoea stewartii]